jgi:hypothetical protein
VTSCLVAGGECGSNQETLAILVILILGVLWAAVLLPPILRSRSESGRPTGVGDFMSRLGAIGRGESSAHGLPPLQPIMGPVGGPVGSPYTNGNGNGQAGMGPVRVPGGMTPAQRRRRDVLVGLLAAAGVTFMMAFFAGSVMFWVLHLLADGLLGGYIFLLLQMKARRSEQQTKVRPIHPPMHSVPMPAYSEAHVDAPRDAQVLVLRKAGSY